jgi:hypothetical protein
VFDNAPRPRHLANGLGDHGSFSDIGGDVEPAATGGDRPSLDTPDARPRLVSALDAPLNVHATQAPLHVVIPSPATCSDISETDADVTLPGPDTSNPSSETTDHIDAARLEATALDAATDRGGDTPGAERLADLLEHRQRPVAPDRGVGPRLRMIAGIKEDILDWVPEERPRFTRLGAIILNTGLLAGLSFFAALNHVLNAPWYVLVPVALFWAFLVVSFDGWLIASTHGDLSRSRLLLFLPRVLVSILLGAAIAEPLVMWVFQPTITKDVLARRDEDLGHYVAMLRTCNHVTGEPVTGPTCTGYGLDLGGADSPQAKAAELRRAQSQRTDLSGDIAGINSTLRRMEDVARAECNGTKGSGLSGRVGEGPNCRRNRAEADQFRADSQLAQKQADLAALNRRITTLNAEVQSVSGDYATLIERAITARAQQRVREQSGTPGLLEQEEALQRLERSGFVLAAVWVLRLLLIAIDTMPVFVKIIGGATSYDRLVNTQTQLARHMHTKDVEDTERAFDHRRLAFEEALQNDLRTERARERAAERQEIDKLVARFRASRRAPKSDPGDDRAHATTAGPSR